MVLALPCLTTCRLLRGGWMSRLLQGEAASCKRRLRQPVYCHGW